MERGRERESWIEVGNKAHRCKGLLQYIVLDFIFVFKEVTLNFQGDNGLKKGSCVLVSNALTIS